MERGNFKNTIVLKNIPSNIVDEAIIVLKENKKAWKLEKINGKKNLEEKDEPVKKDYVVSEAEEVIANYMKKISRDDNRKEEKIKDLKYKRLKKYAYFTTFLLIMQILINVFG